MRFDTNKKRRNREIWRTRFIWIIGLTLPCYLLGFFLYVVNPAGNTNQRPTQTLEPSWTPIDPNALLTQLALTNPAPVFSPTAIIFPSATPFAGFTLAPVVTSPNDIFNSPTPFPTRFISPTPIPTSLNPTATPTTQAPPTSLPTNTPPILLPPSDTPNP